MLKAHQIRTAVRYVDIVDRISLCHSSPFVFFLEALISVRINRLLFYNDRIMTLQ